MPGHWFASKQTISTDRLSLLSTGIYKPKRPKNKLNMGENFILHWRDSSTSSNELSKRFSVLEELVDKARPRL